METAEVASSLVNHLAYRAAEAGTIKIFGRTARLVGLEGIARVRHVRGSSPHPNKL